MAGFGESPADFEAWERALRGGAPAAPRAPLPGAPFSETTPFVEPRPSVGRFRPSTTSTTPPPVTPPAAAAVPAAAAASPGFMSAAMRALGPLGALILADRFSSRNDPRLPPSFIKGPEELYVDAVKALQASQAPETPIPFKFADRPIGTQYVQDQQDRPTREDSRAPAVSIPRAQVSRSAAAPTVVASPTFMDMLAQQAAMRGRERESYGTETAPPLPSAPKREYEPGMRG